MDTELTELSKPWEILDLQDGESQMIRIDNCEYGTMKIKTGDVPDGKTITALRLHVPVGIKPSGAPYFDVTSQTLIAQLDPWITYDKYHGKIFKVTKHGVAPRARFTLEVQG